MSSSFTGSIPISLVIGYELNYEKFMTMVKSHLPPPKPVVLSNLLQGKDAFTLLPPSLAPIDLVITSKMFNDIETKIFNLDEGVKFYFNDEEMSLDNGDFYGSVTITPYSKVIIGVVIEDDIDIADGNKMSCSLEVFGLSKKIEKLVTKNLKKNKTLDSICEDSEIKMHFMVR